MNTEKIIPTHITSKHIVQFQNKILGWYQENKREGLPWRDSFDPYKVLVSEIMLQQTQVDRVIPKFEAFIDELPSFDTLADAERSTLFRLRSGLGFNSRVLRLQQCAQILLQEYNGVLPQDREVLRQLPGIGVYTSASLLAFVYNISAPVVDTNIRRVFIAELGIDQAMPQRGLEIVASILTPDGQANDWNNALMDYGALVATVSITGIKPRSKQSKFAGSTRQVRGNILKYLVAHEKATIEQLRSSYPHKEFDLILQQMLKEEILVQLGDTISIE